VTTPQQREPTVLLLHNRYREPGGEETSVAAIAALLRSRGHRVELLERSSAALEGARGKLTAGAAMLRGGVAPGEVRAAVARSGAQVVHAHNVHPLLGARALAAAREAGARVVLHLHNYRLFCAIATAYRDHDHCTRCRGRNTLPGLRLRCRGGYAEAAAYAAGLALQQPRLLERADRLVAPSAAAADRLARFGLPRERLEVLHNFLPDERFARTSHAASGRYALLAGRLEEEKGIETAVEAAVAAGVPLFVAGAGPERKRLARFGATGQVRFAGRLSAPALAEARRRAAFTLAPSRWDEPCPYSVIEAMGAGLPVLAADVGGLPEVVGEDSVLPRGNSAAWATAMRALWEDRDRRRALGQAALARARELFGAERFYSGLMRIYADERRP
jgi:glycosyltransferase involved in cell wall biosynthesis